MRALLFSVVGLGVVLLLGSAFLIIDRAATPDRREAVQTAVGDTIYDLAETHDERREEGERSRGLARIAAVVRDLNEGVFKSFELDVPTAMPPPPPGWERRPYDPADGTAITGAELVKSMLSVSTTNTILKSFDEARGGRRLSDAVTYVRGDRLAALSMESSVELLREAEAGENRKTAVAAPFARLDGIPVKLHRQFSTDHRTGRDLPVGYRYFSMDLDGQLAIALITNAADADVLAILGAIDFAALDAALPVRVAAYRPGSGAVFAGGAPSEDPPGPSPGMRALGLVGKGMTDETAEGWIVHAIAEGRIASWADVPRLRGGPVAPTPLLVDLLGPAPEELAGRTSVD